MLTSSETFCICACLKYMTTLFDILSKEEISTSEGVSIVTLHYGEVPVNINFQNLHYISFHLIYNVLGS